MECCEYRVDPLLLLGLIAAIGGLTFFLQQQGEDSHHRALTHTVLTVVANINGRRSLREQGEGSAVLRLVNNIHQSAEKIF